jgi:hypothetical protein
VRTIDLSAPVAARAAVPVTADPITPDEADAGAERTEDVG